MAFRHPDIYRGRGLLLGLAKTRRTFHPTTAFVESYLDSNLAALPEMLAKTGDQLFGLDFKSLAYPQNYRPAHFQSSASAGR